MPLLDTIDYYIAPIRLRFITFVYFAGIFMAEFFLKEFVHGYSDVTYKIAAVISIIWFYAGSGIIARLYIKYSRKE
jgi:hypothetical protein